MEMSSSQPYRIVKNSDFSDLKSLPADTGGKHLANSLGATDAPYGYYIYLPAGYEQTAGDYPLLIFLHGDGERGNSSKDAQERIARLLSWLLPRWYSRVPAIREKPMKRIFSVKNWPIFRSALDLVLIHGPPHLIHNGRWTPPYPMIVASPQSHDADWQPEKIDAFIRYIMKNYPANQSRIYLTGLSMGADGIYLYLTETGNRSLIAAAVTICGEGDAAEAKKAEVPIWIFHGEADDVVPLQKAIEMKGGFSNVPEAKLTMYPNAGHDVWDQTYDLSGMGKESKEYDPYNISIYDWLFNFSLSEE